MSNATDAKKAGALAIWNPIETRTAVAVTFGPTVRPIHTVNTSENEIYIFCSLSKICFSVRFIVSF